jgi:hypothetical protein
MLQSGWSPATLGEKTDVGGWSVVQLLPAVVIFPFFSDVREKEHVLYVRKTGRPRLTSSRVRWRRLPPLQHPRFSNRRPTSPYHAAKLLHASTMRSCDLVATKIQWMPC